MKLRQKGSWYGSRYPGEYSIQDAYEIECGGSAGATSTIVGMVLEILHGKGAFSDEEILSMLNSHNESWEQVPAVEHAPEEPTEDSSELPAWLLNKVPESDG